MVAIDILAMDPIAGVDFAQLDFLDPDAPAEAEGDARRRRPMSCSPTWRRNATGHRQTDHLRIMALAEAAAEFAREVLAPGGTFLAKVLQGGTEADAARRAQARLRERASTSSRRRAARIRPSSTCWRRAFAARQ